jgi:hypothetical protein
MEKYRLREFDDNRVLRMTFGPKKEQMTGE